MASAGMVIEVGGALALRRVVASLLYGLKAWDPATLAGRAGSKLVSSTAGGQTSPIRALSHER
jgi:hypothetical protein